MRPISFGHPSKNTIMPGDTFYLNLKFTNTARIGYVCEQCLEVSGGDDCKLWY